MKNSNVIINAAENLECFVDVMRSCGWFFQNSNEQDVGYSEGFDEFVGEELFGERREIHSIEFDKQENTAMVSMHFEIRKNGDTVSITEHKANIPLEQLNVVEMQDSGEIRIEFPRVSEELRANIDLEEVLFEHGMI